MNGIYALVHQANFSEGEFAKIVPFPTFFFFFFLNFFQSDFFCPVRGFSRTILASYFLFVCNQCSWGSVVEMQR